MSDAAAPGGEDLIPALAQFTSPYGDLRSSSSGATRRPSGL